MKPREEARTWSAQCDQDARFTEAVLRETRRMNGYVERACPVALLTSLKPEGMSEGRILCPNAGLDQSNIENHWAIGWPHDPVQSARHLREAWLGGQGNNRKRLGVIITDSCCRPGRIGVTAFALTYAGIEPILSSIGTQDLFGKPLRVTREACADQLATAANAIMGNAAQSTPAVVIRGYDATFVETSGWVPGIDPVEDIFSPIPGAEARG